VRMTQMIGAGVKLTFCLDDYMRNNFFGGVAGLPYNLWAGIPYNGTSIYAQAYAVLENSTNTAVKKNATAVVATIKKDDNSTDKNTMTSAVAMYKAIIAVYTKYPTLRKTFVMAELGGEPIAAFEFGLHEAYQYSLIAALLKGSKTSVFAKAVLAVKNNKKNGLTACEQQLLVTFYNGYIAKVTANEKNNMALIDSLYTTAVETNTLMRSKLGGIRLIAGIAPTYVHDIAWQNIWSTVYPEPIQYEG